MPDKERQPVTPVVLEDGELQTDPKAYQEYLLLSQVREKELEAGETVGEE